MHEHIEIGSPHFPEYKDILHTPLPDIDKPQKSVIRGPFHKWPDPFALTAKRMDVFGRKLVEFESTQSPGRLPGLLWKAVRS